MDYPKEKKYVQRVELFHLTSAIILTFFLFLLILQNYSSVITVHPETIDGKPGTMVIESFMVDVPDGNTKDETCYFVKALINCNHKSLSEVSERMAMDRSRV